VADDPERPHTHLVEFPEALEVFFSRMDEMKVVLGPRAAPEVDRLGSLVQQALAARERGDAAAAVARIGEAMRGLAALATHALPAEAPALRGMVERFQQAMHRGAVGEAREAADVMRARSGSVVVPRKAR
jgi:hypothetical protein